MMTFAPRSPASALSIPRKGQSRVTPMNVRPITFSTATPSCWYTPRPGVPGG